MLRACLPLVLLATGAAAADGGPAAGNDAAPTISAESQQMAKILRAARFADRVWQQRLDLHMTALQSATLAVRLKALTDLTWMGDSAAATRISGMLGGDRSPEELIAVMHALLGLKAAYTVEVVRRMTTHSNEQVRQTALHVVDRFGRSTEWRTRLRDESAPIRDASLVHEAIVGVNESAAILVQGLRHERNAVTRRLCAFGLGRLNAIGQADALVDGLTDPNAMVRATCAQVLALFGHKPAIPWLIRTLEQFNEPALAEALAKLSGQDFGYKIDDTPVRRSEAIERADRWWGAQQPAP